MALMKGVGAGKLARFVKEVGVSGNHYVVSLHRNSGKSRTTLTGNAGTSNLSAVHI